MKKVLIYGFKPFKNYKKNVSQEIIRKFDRKGYIRIVFSVVHEKDQILRKIEKHQPDIVIGLGQGKERLLSIERKAKNIFKTEKSKRRRKISPQGPKQYLVNLKLKKIPETRISYDAGDYVCNFSMYIIMDFIKKKKLKIKFAFIHIPKDYNPQKAFSAIQKIIASI